MNLLSPDLSSDLIIHIAIKAYNLEKTKLYYQDVVGAKLFRVMDDRITFGLRNLQLVCHLSKQKSNEEQASFYPNHFGLTFRNIKDYQEYYDRILLFHKRHVYKFESFRFEGRPDEHKTFILKDPSSNFIEIKCYRANYDSF